VEDPSHPDAVIEEVSAEAIPVGPSPVLVEGS